MPNGYGEYIGKNGYYDYKCFWKNGKRHGEGVLTFGDGGKYEGNYDDKR